MEFECDKISNGYEKLSQGVISFKANLQMINRNYPLVENEMVNSGFMLTERYSGEHQTSLSFVYNGKPDMNRIMATYQIISPYCISTSFDIEREIINEISVSTLQFLPYSFKGKVKIKNLIKWLKLDKKEGFKELELKRDKLNAK